MLSPRTGLPIPDPDRAYDDMTTHIARCLTCHTGDACAEGEALRKVWGEAQTDLALIEAELDAQAQDLSE